MTQTEEIAGRVKAAMRMAGLSGMELEKKVEFSRSTLNRKLAGDYSFDAGELFEIARACKVPLWFLEDGWEGWRKALTPEDLERLSDELFPPDAPPGD